MGVLDSCSVLISGGGTGIGAACAHSASKAGAAVTICGRTEQTLNAVASSILESNSRARVNVVVGDVTVEGDVEAIVASAVAFGGGLSGVIANAGGGGLPAPLHRQDVAEFDRILRLNVVGTFLFVKHSVSHLIEASKQRARSGSFVGMSSIASHLTHPFFGAYTVAKAGIDQLMRNAADEYGPAEVRFNAVRPGFVATEMMELIPRDSSVYASYLANTPMGDVGLPDEVAEATTFLLSDSARWITGQLINVDGGHSLRRGPDFSEFVPQEP